MQAGAVARQAMKGRLIDRSTRKSVESLGHALLYVRSQELLEEGRYLPAAFRLRDKHANRIVSLALDAVKPNDHPWRFRLSKLSIYSLLAQHCLPFRLQ